MLYAVDDKTEFTDLSVKLRGEDINFLTNMDYKHSNRYNVQTKLSVDIGIGATLGAQVEMPPIPLTEQEQAFFLSWK